VKLKRGDKVVIWFASANRDEDIWRDVDRFDITRDPNPHLAFGIGQHFCLGASLARMQLDCILTELVTRIPDIELTGKPNLLRSSLVAGIKSMPVEFTPE
jgi:cytochrome P450